MDSMANSHSLEEKMFDKNLKFSESLLHSALNELIANKQDPTAIDNNKSSFTLKQSLEFILADWPSFYSGPKCVKYRYVYQRALEIITREGGVVIDSDRYQHDLECFARIASSLKLLVIQNEIQQLLPPIAESTLGIVKTEADQSKGKVKEAWILLKNLGRQHIEKKNWKIAMDCFSRCKSVSNFYTVT